jgi:hypothetical protein
MAVSTLLIDVGAPFGDSVLANVRPTNPLYHVYVVAGLSAMKTTKQRVNLEH